MTPDVKLLADLLREEGRRNAELDELRADLRNAAKLLAVADLLMVQRGDAPKAMANWVRERDALLAKHKPIDNYGPLA